MSTRPLIVPNERLLALAELPSDAKVESVDLTAGSSRGEFDGVCMVISSKEFKPEDKDKPIELRNG